jgi:deoxyribodipyrimidine photo-lyase
LVEADPRVRVLSRGAPGHRGSFVVYWAQSARRARDNAGLSYAIARANEWKLPVLVYEALRVDYPFASDRFHTFVLEGARSEAEHYEARGAQYAFFLPRTWEEARGVVARLCARAALLVTDDSPTFVVPRHLAALAKTVGCAVHAFDDNAVVPLSLFPKEEYAARTLRPKFHRLIASWLRPIDENTARVTSRMDLPFEETKLSALDLQRAVEALPIDHGVGAVPLTRGGRKEAELRLARFVERRLQRYSEDHNHPDLAATSGLSPYLHFGMIGARHVALAVRGSDVDQPARDAFLEQLLVRRGLAFNLAAQSSHHTTYDALPEWAKKTLAEHRRDRRPSLVSRSDLEAARSPDPVWNAAQRELLETGVIHNYMRMLWGKGVLAWKAAPEEAFLDLVYLNDKYALDGRDPNSYANILWCFGKHDRPWGPTRPIFGTVRYMSTTAARKKLEMSDWLARWSSQRPLLG